MSGNTWKESVQLSPLSFCVCVFVTSCVCLCVFVSPCALPSPLKGKYGNTWKESVQLSPLSLCVLSLCVCIFMCVCLFVCVFVSACVFARLCSAFEGGVWQHLKGVSCLFSFPLLQHSQGSSLMQSGAERCLLQFASSLSSLGCSKTSQADFWVLGVNFGFVGIFHCQL